MATGLAEEVVPRDEAALTAEFIEFLRAASLRRHPTGTVRRFNQGRATACVDAEFTVPDGLPGPHRVGLFAQPATYPAFIRFANASSASDEEKDVRGMSIAVSGVPGDNLTPGMTRQDFVLNSHPVMMAPDAREFMALLQANEAGGLRRVMYFATHLKAARIARASRQNPTCHLDIPYFSATPYRFGEGRAVKYVVRPASDRTSRLPDRLTPDYLQDAMRSHLRQADALFDVLVQFHVDDRHTPIEDATVEWTEPEHRVARIRIPKQNIDEGGRAAACEESAFNPWHCLPAHRPLGNMNRARREIYRALAELRRGRG